MKNHDNKYINIFLFENVIMVLISLGEQWNNLVLVAMLVCHATVKGKQSTEMAKMSTGWK